MSFRREQAIAKSVIGKILSIIVGDRLKICRFNPLNTSKCKRMFQLNVLRVANKLVKKRLMTLIKYNPKNTFQIKIPKNNLLYRIVPYLINNNQKRLFLKEPIKKEIIQVF